MTERIGVIYGLVDPRNGVIRYVGLTMAGVGPRFRHHLQDAIRGKRGHRNSWIRKLLAMQERPFPVILETVREDLLDNAEIRWIGKMRSEVGPALTNVADGGDHPTVTPETRMRISAAKMGHEVSAETRMKLRKASLGRTLSADTKAKIGSAAKGNRHALGNRMSEEARERIRSASTGRRHTADARLRMSIAQKGRGVGRHPSPETLGRMAISVRKTWNDPEVRARRLAGLRRSFKDPQACARRSASHMGIRPSATTLERLRAWKRGPMTQETRDRLKSALTGRKLSAEHRRRMSEGMKGQRHVLGHKHTAETKAKMSAAHRGRRMTEETKARLSVAKKGQGRGRRLSAEHRARISSGLARWRAGLPCGSRNPSTGEDSPAYPPPS